MKSIKLNFFKRILHRIKRAVKRMVLFSKIDKNEGPTIDLSKIDNATRDAIKIIKKVAADDKSVIYISKRSHETIIYNTDFRILIQHNDVKISNVYIQKEMVYVVNLEDRAMLFVEWLISRRIEVNFNKQYNAIKSAYEKQLNKLLNE